MRWRTPARSVWLAAYLWTENLPRALRVSERIKSGMIWVNRFFLRDLRTPFGGQGGRYAVEFWTEPKLVCVAYGAEPEADSKETRDG